MNELTDLKDEMAEVVHRVKYHGDVVKLEDLERWLVGLIEIDDTLMYECDGDHPCDSCDELETRVTQLEERLSELEVPDGEA